MLVCVPASVLPYTHFTRTSHTIRGGGKGGHYSSSVRHVQHLDLLHRTPRLRELAAEPRVVRKVELLYNGGESQCVSENGL